MQIILILSPLDNLCLYRGRNSSLYPQSYLSFHSTRKKKKRNRKKANLVPNSSYSCMLKKINKKMVRIRTPRFHFLQKTRRGYLGFRGRLALILSVISRPKIKIHTKCTPNKFETQMHLLLFSLSQTQSL